MDAIRIWHALRHPQKSYRLFREWRAEEKCKSVVRINHPRMKIKGLSHPNSMGDKEFPSYYAFFGIPYAEPPIGALRFQPPQPLSKRKRADKYLKAYNEDKACLQPSDLANEAHTGSENCLYLNIYTPKKPKYMLVKSPVLVYIHGGGFEKGSASIDNVMPDAVIRENLVVVTVNYRLHIFGFLNTGTDECRGNAGLKDQVAALRWVKANIEKFGGNPNNVTIMGHSAGATCVNLHMISPLSKGLFHKAIVMGGGLHCPWGYQGDDQRPKVLFLRALGLDNELRNTLVSCLMSETPERLLATTLRITLDIIELEPTKLQVFGGPTLEKNIEGAFLPQAIEQLMRSAEPVPLIAGITAREGNMFILDRGHKLLQEKEWENFDKLVKDNEEFIKFLMENLRWSDESARKHMNTIRRWYFPELARMSEDEIQDQLAKLITDICFRRFYDSFKIGPSGETPIHFYVYRFSFLAGVHRYRSTNCGRKRRLILGPTHGDDLNYVLCPLVLKSKYYKLEFVPKVKHVINHMSSMWGNFCKTGHPRSAHETGIIWRSHSERSPCYLNITETSSVVDTNLNQIEWQRLSQLVDSEPVVQTPLPSPLHNIFDLIFPSRRANLKSAPRSSLGESPTESVYTSAESSDTESEFYHSMRSKEEAGEEEEVEEVEPLPELELDPEPQPQPEEEE